MGDVGVLSTMNSRFDGQCFPKYPLRLAVIAQVKIDLTEDSPQARFSCAYAFESWAHARCGFVQNFPQHSPVPPQRHCWSHPIEHLLQKPDCLIVLGGFSFRGPCAGLRLPPFPEDGRKANGGDGKNRSDQSRDGRPAFRPFDRVFERIAWPRLNRLLTEPPVQILSERVG